MPIAHHARVAVVLAGLLHFPAFGQSTDAERMLDSLRELPVGLGASPQLTTPVDNPPSILKIELGPPPVFRSTTLRQSNHELFHLP